MKILDCTLRDGANIVGKGFSGELTQMMLKGLIQNNIRTIELGNCYGIGAYKANNAIAPLTDEEYLKLAGPYASEAELGVFMLAKNGSDENAKLVKDAGFSFIRVGANAGEEEVASRAVAMVKKAGLTCRYAVMKAYTISAHQLAANAATLVESGLDEITLMDSAGTMLPIEVAEYVSVLTSALPIPVGFHGHNNLGLSAGNALAAYNAGAKVLDAGLMGMARSAGNCATELLIAAFQRMGMMQDIDLLGLLDFIESTLAPAMEKNNYKAAVMPKDLVLGLAGCHSSFEGLFREVAAEYDVPLYKLIVQVSAEDKKAPSRALIEKYAASMK